MIKHASINSGFTIVELLVVIVVIGILAAITIVSYTGISSRATVASLQSDLTSASQQLKLFQVEYSNYPTTINCAIPDSSTNKCIKSSLGNDYTYYQVDNTASPKIFSLYATDSSTSKNYRITDSSAVGSSSLTNTSCLAILNAGESTGDGMYVIMPTGASTPFQAYCDMTTDGGGWTIVTAHSGTATGQYGLADDTESTNNPLSYKAYNINLLKKEYLSAVSTESLIKRSTGVWIKANHTLFDENLVGSGNQHTHWQVTVTSNSGETSVNSQMGYSNYLNSGGGDYGITTSGVAFDHHNTSSYYHLNASCVNMYFYNYGTTYNVNRTLGSWSSTVGCSSGGLQMGGWYAAVR